MNAATSPSSRANRFASGAAPSWRWCFAPEPPLEDWFRELDEWSKRSPGYFVGRPVMLDVAALPLDKDGLAALIADLSGRDIRIMGVEGTKASWLGLGMPPLVSGGRAATRRACRRARDAADGRRREAAGRGREAPLTPSRVAARRSAPAASLLHRQPGALRPVGDLPAGRRHRHRLGRLGRGGRSPAARSTSTARCAAGPSPARPATPRARIFCRKLEAELLAIDGLYRTADEMDRQFRGRPVQAWLDGDAMTMAALELSGS